MDDLDPQIGEKAKDFQRRLKELTWSSSLPARAMQLEIANVKQKLKELLSEKKDHQRPKLKSAQEVQQAELEKAKEELAKAKAELQAAEKRLERRKRKNKEKTRKTTT